MFKCLVVEYNFLYGFFLCGGGDLWEVWEFG